MYTNRLYRLTLSLLFGTSLLLSTLCPLDAAESPPVPAQKASLQSLIDLDRHYNLSFLWFDRLAVGQLSFRRDLSAPNRYRAILDARTLGVAAWLTGERKQHYETLMEMTPQGRFVAIEYRSMIHKNKGGQVVEQTKSYKFEPATRTIFVTRQKADQKGPEEPRKIVCESCPVDFLTAGFNFISGADGPLEPGVRKEILTFTDKGESHIFIEVLRASDWPKTSFLTKGSGTLLKITLPTEILDTGGGAVYALLDEKFLPQRVIVEKVLGLGDVRGELRR
ncbi:MAG: DUF3108 domain-containing protein [Desulfuromonadales bacterium]|nr:DUF3108 domain-containing protein [Desulfuromonadales bacterium]